MTHLNKHVCTSLRKIKMEYKICKIHTIKPESRHWFAKGRCMRKHNKGLEKPQYVTVNLICYAIFPLLLFPFHTAWILIWMTKRQGVISEGIFRSQIIRKIWFTKKISVRRFWNNPIYPLLSIRISTWTEHLLNLVQNLGHWIYE